MKQIALLIATTVTLALSGAAQAQAPVRAPGFSPPAHPAPGMGPGMGHGMRQGMGRPGFGHPGSGAHPPHGRRHPGGLGYGGWNWVAPSVAPIVTHDFEDPLAPPPRPYIARRPRSMTLLADKPVLFREPPHVIYLGRYKLRPPIQVVRRGVITNE
jgi:hypothetical protein